MIKSTIAFAALTLTAFGWQQTYVGTPLRLKEERMILEYNATSNEAAMVVEGESEESLERVEIRSPGGALLVEVRAQEGRVHALSGFKVETREFSFPALSSTYAEGVYDLRARTVEGRPVRGSALFSHELPAAPAVIYPFEGAVAPANLSVAWVPDPQAKGYMVSLEQGESDGMIVQLPAGSRYFQIPRGVLAPGTETHLEIGAIGHNGNRTVVEVSFTTR